MSKVFVDAWAWLALLNKQDRRSHEAQTVMRKLRQEKSVLVTSDTEFAVA
jgi:predicted nucleic acid-binding protein